MSGGDAATENGTMSTEYAGNDNWVESFENVADGDAASASTIGAVATESIADRTTWLRQQLTRPRLLALGALPMVKTAPDPVGPPVLGEFYIKAYDPTPGESHDYDLMSVRTKDNPGAQAKFALPKECLAHGATLTGVSVIFIPQAEDSGGSPRAGLPATPPSITLIRWPSVVGVVSTPLLVELIGTVTYTPVSLADYSAGEFRQIELLGLEHVVDVEAYTYQLVVEDESGANALPSGGSGDGAIYCAARLTYAES